MNGNKKKKNAVVYECYAQRASCITTFVSVLCLFVFVCFLFVCLFLIVFCFLSFFFFFFLFFCLFVCFVVVVFVVFFYIFFFCFVFCLFLLVSSRKHAYIILTPLNPTFI